MRIRDHGVGAAGPEAAGLAGMRERVGAWGGRLTAGPIEGGGYEVVAMLPRDGDDR